MTTDNRAVQPRQREASPSHNFHAPAARDSYGRHFSGIGIASVAAAAAQLRGDKALAAAPAFRHDLPAILLQDHDAA